MFKNALVSVADKSGLVEFLKPYADKGLRIVSTGGTAKHLRDNGFTVVDVSEQTDFPEVMNGRVKTLHPKVHMALLARDWDSGDMATLSENKIEAFDLVIGNLYPFALNWEKFKEGKMTSERELMEFVDIGGPSLLRAAAKSFERITVVCDPSDYAWISQKSELTANGRKFLASKVFRHVSAYDSKIAEALTEKDEWPKPDISWAGKFVDQLRYGENPQQTAVWYKSEAHVGWHQAEILQGKALSFNNLLDLQAALSTLFEWKDESACVAVKHNNPCGVGIGKDVLEATKRALAADPVSVFGAIVASSKPIDGPSAQVLSKIFLECIVAPSFNKEAREVLAKKKNLRLLEWPNWTAAKLSFDLKNLYGGYLVQSADDIEATWQESWTVHGEAPSEQIKSDLLFSWKVCAHLKSNAIAIAGNGTSLGLGMGQVNRVDAVAQAIGRMKEYHPNCKEAVLASDAFFPFADSIEKIADAGIKWVIQPGGSMRDEEVIAKAKEKAVTLVMTGRRHFLH